MRAETDVACHTCYMATVGRCAARVDRSLLMCARHWRKVPPELQREVYRTWKHWIAGAGSMTAWIQAANDARDAVATRGYPRA